MLFLTFNNANIQFAEKKLIWRSYTIEKVLSTICPIELINEKKFAQAALDENIEAFIVYITLLILKITIYLARKAQIALLIAKEVIVLAKYTNFGNVFSNKLAEMLPKRININEYAIKLIDDKQLFYN